MRELDLGTALACVSHGSGGRRFSPSLLLCRRYWKEKARELTSFFAGRLIEKMAVNRYLVVNDVKSRDCTIVQSYVLYSELSTWPLNHCFNLFSLLML